MTTGVAFDAVSVTYGVLEAVRSVTLEAASGEWLTLIGPNGAGKSSLLRTIVGRPPTAGSIRIGDVDVSTVRSRQRAHLVAYVPQHPVFPPGLSVFDYVLLGRTPHMGFLASESRNDIEEVWGALEALELTPFAGRDVSTLSGGETQRVAMARVVAQRAPTLVLDEATASLDVARQHQVLELIEEIRADRGLTVIAAMHDLTAAAQFSDRVALMDAGRIRSIGVPGDVLSEDTLRTVYDPSIRVLDIDGTIVVVALRD